MFYVMESRKGGMSSNYTDRTFLCKSIFKIATLYYSEGESGLK